MYLLCKILNSSKVYVFYECVLPRSTQCVKNWIFLQSFLVFLAVDGNSFSSYSSLISVKTSVTRCTLGLIIIIIANPFVVGRDQATSWTDRGLNPSRCKRFLFSRTSRLPLGPTASNLIGIWVLLRIANLTSRLRPVPRLRMSGVIPLLPFYAVMAYREYNTKNFASNLVQAMMSLTCIR